jgi:flagellar motor switch protein FliM
MKNAALAKRAGCTRAAGKPESMQLETASLQEEITDVLRSVRELAKDDDPTHRAQAYDFRRPDRIAKDQLRAIHLLHENFARSLASSLSAYLRAYAAVTLVSVEQLSFQEFTQCLHSPTCMITLKMKPCDGSAVLELSPSLVFPIVEMLLGGTGKAQSGLNREITEIEQSILEGLFRIVLHDLRNAWHPVTPMEFSIDGHETEPQLLQILAPSEAVVAISIEVRLGDLSGMMNIGIPSIIVKMLRQRFDQQWSLRRGESKDEDHARVFRLISAGKVSVEARLQGSTVAVSSLLAIKEGSTLVFDNQIGSPVDVILNGTSKFQGNIVPSGRKRAIEITTT